MILAILTPAHFGMAQECSMEIVVVDQETKDPLPETQILIRKESTGRPFQTELTDSSGIAIFEKLSSDASYYFEAQLPGHLWRGKTLTCAPTNPRFTIELPKEWKISLIKIITDPQPWHNRRVQIIGFLNLQFEGNALYLHKEDWEHSLAHNAIWIDTRNSECTNWKALKRGYVLLEGTFDAY
ncbi:MAG: hypothetical protein E2P03_04990, partial [Acidobacteria bacterium]